MSMRRSYPTSPGSSEMSSKNGHNPHHHSHIQTNEMIQSQNDQMVEQMSGKIRQLKSLSIDIGDEVRHQNTDLQGMGDDFESAGGLLGSSMKRLKSMTSAGHNRWMLYMVLFVVLVFFVLYYFIRWR